MQAGDKISYKKSVDTYRPYYYAGASGDFNPIHIDDNFAKAVGLPGKILQGLCTMAFCQQAVIEAAGRDPRRLKRLKVEFRGNVLCGDTVNIEGEVQSVERGVAKIAFQAVNQKGELVIGGGEAEVAV